MEFPSNKQNIQQTDFTNKKREKNILIQKKLAELNKIAFKSFIENICNENNFELQSDSIKNLLWFSIYIRTDLFFRFGENPSQYKKVQKNIENFFEELKLFKHKNMDFKNLSVETLFDLGNKFLDDVSWEIYYHDEVIATHILHDSRPVKKQFLQYVSLAKTEKEIFPEAYMYLDNLKKIILNESLEKIGARAFSCCFELNEILYQGTMEKWSKIKKCKDWAEEINTNVVKCLDGEVFIEK